MVDSIVIGLLLRFPQELWINQTLLREVGTNPKIPRLCLLYQQFGTSNFIWRSHLLLRIGWESEGSASEARKSAESFFLGYINTSSLRLWYWAKFFKSTAKYQPYLTSSYHACWLMGRNSELTKLYTTTQAPWELRTGKFAFGCVLGPHSETSTISSAIEVMI